MTTPKTRPNKITDSYLAEEFKRIFGRPAGGFPEGVVSNADIALLIIVETIKEKHNQQLDEKI